MVVMVLGRTPLRISDPTRGSPARENGFSKPPSSFTLVPDLCGRLAEPRPLRPDPFAGRKDNRWNSLGKGVGGVRRTAQWARRLLARALLRIHQPSPPASEEPLPLRRPT